MSSVQETQPSQSGFTGTHTLGGSTPPFVAARASRPSRLWPSLAIAAIVCACISILFLTGNPIRAALPLVLAGVVMFVWTQPLRRSLFPLLFAQLFFFAPSGGEDGLPLASGPLWNGLMGPGFDLFNEYLNRLTGINALSISLQEVAYIAFLALLTVRTLRDDKIDEAGRSPTANVLYVFLAIEIAAVLGLELWGAATGGSMRSSLFQIRMFLWWPIETVVICHAFRDERDFIRLGLLATLAACAKIPLGIYFIWHDAWRKGLKPEFMTGHHDSLLYVLVIFSWLAACIHRRSWKRILGAAIVIAWIGVGIYVNNRRLAYLSLGASLFVFAFLAPTRVKKVFVFLGFCALPFLVVYLAIARTHPTGIFAPGAQLIGMSQLSDPSAMWRELENQNLIFTLNLHRVFGSGWGHEYVEFTPLPDISRFMPQYRLTPHNSVLWMLGIGGILGFALMWMPIVVGVFLASRSYYFAETPTQRTLAATALAAFVCYVNQAWGDMGATGSMPTIVLACGLAISGKLAHETGAWPSSVRLFAGFAPSKRERVKIVALPEPGAITQYDAQ